MSMTLGWYDSVLRGLTRAQRKAWDLVLEYARATGRRCFTYNSINRYWSQSRVRINANTLERRLRELAQLGLLERATGRDGRRLFCLARELYERFVGGSP